MDFLFLDWIRSLISYYLLFKYIGLQVHPCVLTGFYFFIVFYFHILAGMFGFVQVFHAMLAYLMNHMVSYICQNLLLLLKFKAKKN